jgi:N-acetylglutamate synthase-like GNAT family acetyltransferase
MNANYQTSEFGKNISSRVLRIDFSRVVSRFAEMSASSYRVRRATLEDVGSLTELWTSMNFAVADLARRTTEFQVAEDAGGKLLGAVAIQIAEKQGRIHSEAFGDFALADQLRPLLWERLQAVANNHGLLRLWTDEKAPFWNHCGLGKADAEAIQKLPVLWRGQTTEWLTIKLREDVAAVISADKEFAMFMEAEKQKTERTMQNAKLLKLVATLVSLGLLIVVCAGAFLILKKNPKLLGH